MSGSFRWILSGGRDQIQLRNPIDSWLPAPLSLSRAAMFLERTLEPGRATAESVKRFNVRFSWPKSFLFFFWGRWVFWFQKMLRILMCQLSLTFFLPIKICEGRWGWRSWRKRCSDCSIPPRISKQVEKHEWEIPKNTDEFLPWSSHHSTRSQWFL